MNRFEKRSRILTLLFAIASILVASFIFNQSTKSIAESSALSGKYSVVMQAVFDPNFRIPPEVFHLFIRKLAHFAEFFALGVCVGGFTVNLGNCLRRRYFALPVCIVLFVAAADECLQIFTARGSSFADVVLDFSGALVGLAMVAVISYIYKKFFTKR